MTLVRPTESEKDIQNLDRIKNSQLRSQFIDQCNTLRKKIFKKIKPKVINSNVVNGRMFLQMAKLYVQSINNGSLPNIENAWNYLC